MYLFDELDAGLQVHTEIDKDPFDTFALVLFLLKYEHVVVEKLLQLLIGEVNAELLETVELQGRVPNVCFLSRGFKFQNNTRGQVKTIE